MKPTGTQPAHGPHDFDIQPQTGEGAGLNRRNLLKIMGISAGLAALDSSAREWDDSTITREAMLPDVEDIPSALPPELADNPPERHNAHYRKDFTTVVTDALAMYEQDGGRPFYRKPDYYLSQGTLLRSAAKQLMHGQTLSIAGKGGAETKLLDLSSSIFITVEGIYENDPGSSARGRVTQRFIRRGWNPNRPPADESKEVLSEVYSTFYHDAKAFIQTISGGKSVSTAELCNYFLHVNNGDIVRSLLDTTIFLKMAARTDLEKLTAPAEEGMLQGDVIADFSYARATEVASLFKDEFATEVPLDKLLEVVPEDSRLNNLDTAATDKRPWKDYDPVNRAGLPYHIWNIILLTACADPPAAQKIVVGYYNKLTNPYDVTREQGRIKAAADFKAISQAHDFRHIFDRYKVD